MIGSLSFCFALCWLEANSRVQYDLRQSFPTVTLFPGLSTGNFQEIFCLGGLFQEANNSVRLHDAREPQFYSVSTHFYLTKDRGISPREIDCVSLLLWLQVVGFEVQENITCDYLIIRFSRVLEKLSEFVYLAVRYLINETWGVFLIKARGWLFSWAQCLTLNQACSHFSGRYVKKT